MAVFRARLGGEPRPGFFRYKQFGYQQQFFRALIEPFCGSVFVTTGCILKAAIFVKKKFLWGTIFIVS